MERREDVVMTDAKQSSTGASRPRPPSSSGRKASTPSEMNGTAKATGAQSLLQTFQQNVHSPAKLVNEIEEHQASMSGTKYREGSAADKHEVKSDVDDADADSLMGDDSDWSHEHVDGTKSLRHSLLPTGLCYDIRMRYHCEVKPTMDVHPEDPRRIHYIYKELCKAGLVDDPQSSRPLAPQPLHRIHAREATEGEISHVHTPAHYEFVKSTKGNYFMHSLFREIFILTFLCCRYVGRGLDRVGTYS